MESNNGYTTLEQRKAYALEAFSTTSHYDTAIFNYFAADTSPLAFKQSIVGLKELRYGENPHQKGMFYGDFHALFHQISHGKEISYNNLLDIDAALNLISEFDEPTIAILKHNNACGLASRESLATGDGLMPLPAIRFGIRRVIVANRPIDAETAAEMDKVRFLKWLSLRIITGKPLKSSAQRKIVLFG